MRLLLAFVWLILPLQLFAAGDFIIYADSYAAAGGNGTALTPYNNLTNVSFSVLHTACVKGSNVYVKLAGWFGKDVGDRFFIDTTQGGSNGFPISIIPWYNTNPVMSCMMPLTNWVATNGRGSTWYCTNAWTTNTGNYLWMSDGTNDHNYIPLPNNATDQTNLDRFQWVWTNNAIWLRDDRGMPGSSTNRWGYLYKNVAIDSMIYMRSSNIFVTNITFIGGPITGATRTQNPDIIFSGCTWAADALPYISGSSVIHFYGCRLLSAYDRSVAMFNGAYADWTFCEWEHINNYSPATTSTNVFRNCTFSGSYSSRQFAASSGSYYFFTNCIVASGNENASQMSASSSEITGNGTNSSVFANGVVTRFIGGLVSTNILFTNSSVSFPGFLEPPRQGWAARSDDDSANWFGQTNREPVAREFGVTTEWNVSAGINPGYNWATVSNLVNHGALRLNSHTFSHTDLNVTTNGVEVQYTGPSGPATMTVDAVGLTGLTNGVPQWTYAFTTATNMTNLFARVNANSGWNMTNWLLTNNWGTVFPNILLPGTSNVTASFLYWGINSNTLWSNEVIFNNLAVSTNSGFAISNHIINGISGGQPTYTNQVLYETTNGIKNIRGFSFSVDNNTIHWAQTNVPGFWPETPSVGLNAYLSNWKYWGTTATPGYPWALSNVTFVAAMADPFYNITAPASGLFTNGSFAYGRVQTNSNNAVSCDDYSYGDWTIYMSIYPDSLGSNQCLASVGLDAANHITFMLLTDGSLFLETAAGGVTNTLASPAASCPARTWRNILVRNTRTGCEIRTNLTGIAVRSTPRKTTFISGPAIIGRGTNWTTDWTNSYTGYMGCWGTGCGLYAYGAAMQAWAMAHGILFTSYDHGEGQMPTQLLLSWYEGLRDAKKGYSQPFDNSNAAANCMNSNMTRLDIYPAHSFDWNGLFTAKGLSLRRDSPAVGIGVPITGITNLFSIDGIRMTDGNGAPVAKTWDAGAYQNVQLEDVYQIPNAFDPGFGY